MQDRLVNDFKRKNITSIEQANKILPGIIKRYNNQFSVKAENSSPAYLPKLSREELYVRFAKQYTRTINNGLNFSYNGKRYYIDEKNKENPKPRTKIIVCDSKALGIWVIYNNLYFKATEAKDYQKCSSIKPKKQISSQQRSEFGRLGRSKSPWNNYRSDKVAR